MSLLIKERSTGPAFFAPAQYRAANHGLLEQGRSPAVGGNGFRRDTSPRRQRNLQSARAACHYGACIGAIPKWRLALPAGKRAAAVAEQGVAECGEAGGDKVEYIVGPRCNAAKVK